MVYITKEIKELDSKVVKLAASYKPRVNPSNLYQIQQKILSVDKDGKSNLLEVEKAGILGFSYKQRQRSFEKEIKALEEIKVPIGAFKKLYRHKIDESIKKLRMLESLGTADFAERSKELYGYPSKELIKKAYEILELPIVEDQETFNAQKAKRLLQKDLDELNLKWKITTKKLLGYALINTAKQSVVLSSNHNFTENTIKRLAVHEIGTHGVRYLNARLQPLKIFKNFPGYLATEEGLAAFNEELSGYLNNKTLKRYAGRVIAVEYAQDHNLFETYVYLKKYFDKSDALSIAMRVKRGLPNSESLGAFTKDYVYLKGFLEVKEYVKKNPLKYLYYGKVNMGYMKLIKKLEKELKPVKFHPLLAISFDKKKELFE